MKNSTLAAVNFLSLVLLVGDSSAAEQKNFLLRLPAKTSIAMEVNDFRLAVENYRNAQQASGEKDSPLKRLQQDFGFSAADLASLAAGKAWRIDAARAGEELGRVLVLEIADKSKALDLLEREKSESDSGFPKKKETAAAGEIIFWVGKRDEADKKRQLVRILSDRHLVLSDDLTTARRILDHLEKTNVPPDELGFPNFPGEDLFFTAANTKQVVISWLADPWVYLEQRVAAKLASEDERGYLKYARRHGLVGIEALGGSARVSDGALAEFRSYIHAPRPRAHTLKMLTLEPAAKLMVPAWLAGGADDMLLLHADVPQAFQQMDLVFDDMLGEGIDGAYREILEDIKAEDALNIDLEKQLYPHLGPRVYIVRSSVQRSPKKKQRQMLFAIETQNAAAVAAAIRTLMQDDEGVSQIRLPNLSAVIWRIDSEDKNQDQPCITVMQGYAVYATDFGLLEKIAAPAAKQQREKMARINELLDNINRRKGDRPSLFYLRGGEFIATGEAASKDRSAAKKKNAAKGAERLLGAFFSGSASLLPEESDDYASFIDRFTESTTSSIIVGYSRKDGWLLTGSNSIPNASP